ncbi:ABC transporter ATP-binding protein [Ilumatobacter coccineus]|uniref:Branched-chain amino acid transporter ATP-binding protein n=1 Tax=Ilumatobacter coccineus (strain NBRC 103263 / KCTC 29153 / YM16-304) TaxID=1313172 RepID=A0A6C7E3R2_ILUCY|nr:ABC transporter ATP-binding protein [Ilumatobacter coccineus]BAN00932.1 branched-chain amino acid transporter ATP-binding protein [Ilumatobacter coccineus YM16-304]
MLSVEGLTLEYGAVRAIDDVSFKVNEGELFSIVGPNGAGKTSMFNVLTGLTPATSGQVRLDGEVISGLPPHGVAQRGIARSFQNLALFSNSTVLENAMAGRHRLMQRGLFAGMCFWGPAKREEIAHRARVEEILDFLDIDHYRHSVVTELPYGLQKRVELARALATEPRLLLVDEPAAGLNLEETEDIARFLLDVVSEWGATVVLIEHDMGMVMDISDRVLVLDFGRLVGVGTPAEIVKNERVAAAYLGEEVI